MDVPEGKDGDKNKEWKKTDASAEKADEITWTGARELAGGEEHTGMRGSSQQNIVEENRREIEDPETDQRIVGKSNEEK